MPPAEITLCLGYAASDVPSRPLARCRSSGVGYRPLILEEDKQCRRKRPAPTAKGWPSGCSAKQAYPGLPASAVVLSGIGLGVKLGEAGISSFTIVERTDICGVTWWENTYAGAEVDSPSYLYPLTLSDSYDWSRNFARQPELYEYMAQVIEENDLGPHFQYNTTIESAVWDESTQEYEILTCTDEPIHVPRGRECARFIECAELSRLAGDWTILRAPNSIPDAGSTGTCLEGKRVAFFGTGCTAAQVVPEIAFIDEHQDLFQREPGHVLPKVTHAALPRRKQRVFSELR